MIVQRDVDNLEAYPVSRFPSLQFACMDVYENARPVLIGTYFGPRRLIQLLANRLLRAGATSCGVVLLDASDVVGCMNRSERPFWVWGRAVKSGSKICFMFRGERVPYRCDSFDLLPLEVVDSLLGSENRVVNGLYRKWWSGEFLEREQLKGCSVSTLTFLKGV